MYTDTAALDNESHYRRRIGKYTDCNRLYTHYRKRICTYNQVSTRLYIALQEKDKYVHRL